MAPLVLVARMTPLVSVPCADCRCCCCCCFCCCSPAPFAVGSPLGSLFPYQPKVVSPVVVTSFVGIPPPPPLTCRRLGTHACPVACNGLMVTVALALSSGDFSSMAHGAVSMTMSPNRASRSSSCVMFTAAPAAHSMSCSGAASSYSSAALRSDWHESVSGSGLVSSVGAGSLSSRSKMKTAPVISVISTGVGANSISAAASVESGSIVYVTGPAADSAWYFVTRVTHSRTTSSWSARPPAASMFLSSRFPSILRLIGRNFTSSFVVCSGVSGRSKLGSMSSRTPCAFVSNCSPVHPSGRWYFLTVASAPSYASSMCWGSVGGHSRAMIILQARPPSIWFGFGLVYVDRSQVSRSCRAKAGAVISTHP